MSPGLLAFLRAYKREASGIVTGGGFTRTYGPWVGTRILNDPLGRWRWPVISDESQGGAA